MRGLFLRPERDTLFGLWGGGASLAREDLAPGRSNVSARDVFAAVRSGVVTRVCAAFLLLPALVGLEVSTPGVDTLPKNRWFTRRVIAGGLGVSITTLTVATGLSTDLAAEGMAVAAGVLDC